MMFARAIRLRGAVVGAACVYALCMLPVAGAQQAEDSDVRAEVRVSPTDIAVAAEAGPGVLRALPARTPGAKEAVERIHRASAARAAQLGVARTASTATARNTPTGPYFYPGDVASGGGPTTATATQHALFVNYTGSVASNWGNPERFLMDLNESTFIHLLDQYTGTAASDRYPVGSNAKVRYPVSDNILYEHDIAAIAHAAALQHGAGLGSIYHVFLPQGLDTCTDPTPDSPIECYSPDNPANWFFCAYHDAVQFNDIGWVIFTVEPYQNVDGCNTAAPSPNGQQADSTNVTLSHEIFETISDPIPGGGYYNQSFAFGGNEIADECVSALNADNQTLDPVLNLNGRRYSVQLEYSNTYHACASVP